MIDTLHANKMPRFTCYYEPMLKLPNCMHMGHKYYRQCSHIWLEDVCKVLRHDSYCKWAIEATMVWRTPANYLLANCDHFTACNCETILI
jgi:hypothetical protein